MKADRLNFGDLFCARSAAFPEKVSAPPFFEFKKSTPEGLSPIGTQCEPTGLNAVYGGN